MAMIERALAIRAETQSTPAEPDRKFAQRRDKAVVAVVDTPNIGPEVANALLDFFDEPHNREVVDDILADGVEPRDVVHETRASSVSGKTRSEEQTSELQSLMRISYAVFGLKKKKK